MINEERLYKAMQRLAETDETAAELKTEVSRSKYKLDRVKATIQVHSTGAQELRKAQAIIAPETQEAEETHLEALKAYEALHNDRKTQELVVEVWRSEGANRRAGNIT